MRMLVTFLLLTEPASMNPNPAWQKECFHHDKDLDDDLHQDDDGSADDQEEAVQIGSDILCILIEKFFFEFLIKSKLDFLFWLPAESPWSLIELDLDLLTFCKVKEIYQSVSGYRRLNDLYISDKRVHDIDLTCVSLEDLHQ